MAQYKGAELEDDEIVALYFDLDGASCTSDLDSSYDPSQDPSKFVKDVAGSTTTDNNEDSGYTSEPWQNLEHMNFSGGSGCYVWPESPYIMMGSEGPSAREVYGSLGIRWDNCFTARGDTRCVEKEYRFPSEYAGIDWIQLIQEAYQVSH
ncbi:hypothetical protein F4813DRAFT_393165 [Daldinia decipiens]|uniref:uncharacterized protein n=1 Tax=Daldinia decipiens TaxID=326647 RepID=UPI0020C4B577|nr:uncharacterized protein F4813DRAFT_393165 [Daldinia decipiens]KAI1654013.1 hypothetical protein F4813DRAFT_393165 [Daldinia decipiens]